MQSGTVYLFRIFKGFRGEIHSFIWDIWQSWQLGFLEWPSLECYSAKISILLSLQLPTEFQKKFQNSLDTTEVIHYPWSSLISAYYLLEQKPTVVHWTRLPLKVKPHADTFQIMNERNSSMKAKSRAGVSSSLSRLKEFQSEHKSRSIFYSGVLFVY